MCYNLLMKASYTYLRVPHEPVQRQRFLQRQCFTYGSPWLSMDINGYWWIFFGMDIKESRVAILAQDARTWSDYLIGQVRGIVVLPSPTGG